MTTPIFLHGLDSSGRGTKGSFISQKFPHVLCPDFHGSLEERLSQLNQICQDKTQLVLIGSSYGGLMATCFAIKKSDAVNRLVLLAPALNYEDYTPPAAPCTVPTLLVIGEEDVVTPPELVLPLAERTFANLDVALVDDDHLLHQTFRDLDWQGIAGSG